MWATTHTVSLQGAQGHLVDVQVDVSGGLAGAVLIGRPDVAITESRDRCRSAARNSGFDWPTTKRVTILLSPADLPKRGPHFDLAIAVSVLAAHDAQFPRERLERTAFIGELTLTGGVRCVPGVLPMVMAAAARGIRTVHVPEPQVAEAVLVEGVDVIGVRSLAQSLAVLQDQPIPEAPAVEPLSSAPLISWVGASTGESLDLADVFGMADARYALEVAASGGHHLMLSGPKGAGKTTLAERIPSILPDLAPEEALELTAVHSLAGSLAPGEPVLRRPPFRAPHHSASRTAVLGGGSGRVRPGEVSKAHLGVLFLDEFPLFPADVIDALREPLESGIIRLSRGDEDAVYPARGMVVFGCNPCPCGGYTPVDHGVGCECGELKRRDYQRKLRGPVLDRIDVIRHVQPVRRHELDPRFSTPESSATVRERVRAARDRQARRFAGDDWRLNAQAPGPALKQRWPLTDAAARLLQERILAGVLTQRGGVRVHRLAWTVADLHGVDRPGTEELQVALRLRLGQPLELRTLEERAG